MRRLHVCAVSRRLRRLVQAQAVVARQGLLRRGDDEQEQRQGQWPELSSRAPTAL
jgi:hypothetical protein